MNSIRLLLVFGLALVAAQIAPYGRWVGATNTGNLAACRCPTPAVLPCTNNKDKRQCGTSCYSVNSPSTKCYTGDKTSHSSGNQANGKWICPGSDYYQCGRQQLCQTVTNGGSTGQVNVKAPCYQSGTNKKACWVGDQKKTTGDEPDGIICDEAATHRCGGQCYTPQSAGNPKCYKNDNSAGTETTDTTSSSIVCSSDTQLRCGWGCFAKDATAGEKCWQATGDQKNDAQGIIACPVKSSRCHPGTERDVRTDWLSCRSDGCCTGTSADRYCYDKDKTETCYEGETAKTDGTAVTSGDTWVCPKDTVRCGYKCIAKTGGSRCINPDTLVANADGAKAMAVGALCSKPATHLCNNVCYDPTNFKCYDGALKSTDVGKSATYLCHNSVAVGEVSDCSCSKVGNTACSTTCGCGGGGSSSASSIFVGSVLVIVGLLVFLF